MSHVLIRLSKSCTSHQQVRQLYRYSDICVNERWTCSPMWHHWKAQRRQVMPLFVSLPVRMLFLGPTLLTIIHSIVNFRSCALYASVLLIRLHIDLELLSILQTS